MRRITAFILLTVLLISGCTDRAILVRNAGQLREAISNALPGTEIIMEDGTWNNIEILFEAQGSESKPVILRSKTPGRVIIEGESNLRLAGEYLQVKGLVFRNGDTPGNEVISFKKENGVYANHCRLTECVIENFNDKERFETEIWVALYGKDNRVDHCAFVDKRTQGVTLAVRLVDSLCLMNGHKIDHNFFGPRQNLGSNGGETIRIGTSKYASGTSATLVEDNYFYRCCGETEIISCKSCGNLFLGNTFFECKGSLTFRHGNDNEARDNLFLGNGVKHTGGIRIINMRNKAINNFLYGLKGTRFRGALVLMNGVPNSPVNRYQQVVDAEVLNNTFINCDHILLCAGKDSERTLPPAESLLADNLFIHESKNDIFTLYDDISGITFRNNVASANIVTSGLPGIRKTNLTVSYTEKGLPKPDSSLTAGTGSTIAGPGVQMDETLPKWYPFKDIELVFDSGKVTHVPPGLNTLYDAISASGPGDILLLDSVADYVNSKTLRIRHPLTILSTGINNQAVIRSSGSNMFMIENQGSLKLVGLSLNGEDAPDQAGNALICTSPYSMNRNYKLIVSSCKVSKLDINKSFSFMKAARSTFADSIVLHSCTFEDINGPILSLNAETDELGRYNAEDIQIEDCSFRNVKGELISLLRGGTDESTFGPAFLMKGCSLTDCGIGKSDAEASALTLHGAQFTLIDSCTFSRCGSVNLVLSKDEPVCTVSHCTFINSGKLLSNRPNFVFANNTIN